MKKKRTILLGNMDKMGRYCKAMMIKKAGWI
jgi:hypothetical protein